MFTNISLGDSSQTTVHPSGPAAQGNPGGACPYRKSRRASLLASLARPLGLSQTRLGVWTTDPLSSRRLIGIRHFTAQLAGPAAQRAAQVPIWPAWPINDQIGQKGRSSTKMTDFDQNDHFWSKWSKMIKRSSTSQVWKTWRYYSSPVGTKYPGL